MPKTIFFPYAPQPRLPGLLPLNMVSSISISPDRGSVFKGASINDSSEHPETSLNGQLAVRNLKS